MLNLTRVIDTFPSVTLPSESGGLPVEVSLIAQLGHGSGNHLFTSALSRQRHHAAFVNELDEPSTKLAGTHFSKGDPSSLYSFAVGPKGHPFHCHAGNRIFTAISGSGGAQLRFSTASRQQIEEDPHSFLRALRYVNIPPDCLFTVRFGGETWHQFYPLSRNKLHPVFFALSCHTNELGGNLPEALQEQVLANQATIPSLTELLPAAVLALLQAKTFDASTIPTTTLALDAPAGTLHRVICNGVRSTAGLMRGAWAAWANSSGFLSHTALAQRVIALKAPPEDSLLRQHLTHTTLHHEDTFLITVTGIDLQNTPATMLLSRILEGFLLDAPRSVSHLMAIRNLLVKPLGLRTSPLGCPVSSLLSENTDNLFANEYPVLDQSINAENTHAQVILGADDKHLIFRSCVGVRILGHSQFEVSLGNRVHCTNVFGRLYINTIDAVHRHYVAPTMLRRATDYAITTIIAENSTGISS